MIDIKEMNINEKRWEKYGQNKKYWRNIRKDFSAFQRQKNRSYPLLLNKEDIKKELEKIVKDPASYFYIDEDDGEIKGMCGYRISEQDKYLQTMLFFSLNNRKEFIKEVLDFLIEKYPSYTIIIGVEAQNRLIIDELIKHKFKLSDDLYPASAIPCFNENNSSDVEEVKICQWDNFRDIHEKFFSNIYWTFEKIKEDFENWILYSLSQDGLIRSYIFVKKDNFGDTCEIFGIYGDKFDERIKLVKHALQSIKNVNRIYYFIEDYNEMEACKKLGFKIHGHYQAWEYKSES